MKHIFLLSSLILVGGTILSSCSSDEAFGNPENIKRIEASICKFQMEDSNDVTRTSYTFGANGYDAVWTAGDVLGIYPLGGDQVSFPISDGAGTTNAVFDGGAWALRGTYKYAAYYPFSQENYTISETEIPVTYLGQKQSSNNATTHLAQYDYMAAAATQPSSNGSVTLPFKHLGSYITLPLTLPKAGTYTQLTLTSSSGEFITKGTVDLSAATPIITATETSPSVSLELDNIILTADNLVLTVNMMIAPVNLTGSTITITVTDSNGSTYTNTEKAWTRSAAFLANTTYKASRVLSGSGTGGVIEGGGGLEEDDDTPNMHNGHKYVDLGLPSGLKWATCNVGAETPEDYGYYYAWGEVATKDNYNPAGYAYYNIEGTEIFDLRENISGTQYDVAHHEWGGSWRMPTQSELQELWRYTTWKWDSKNGVYGYTFLGTNGSSIFLPAAASDSSSRLYGYYWSSNIDSNNLYNAFVLFFNSQDYVATWDSYYRFAGLSVRPVTE